MSQNSIPAEAQAGPQQGGGYFWYFFSAPREQVGPPDFDLVVKTVLATFAVFTGYVYSTSLKTLDLGETSGVFGWTAWFCKPSLWAVLALMALLLRYIIGSAIHLTYMYVPPEKGKPSRSKLIILLFKDLLFLVAFGVIAMAISNDTIPKQDGSFAPAPFLRDAMLFLAAGFAWSILDTLSRCIAARVCSKPNTEGPTFFWVIWSVLDAAQFLLTLGILAIGWGPLASMFWLAIVYAIFLVLDVAAILRAAQIANLVNPPAPAAAAPRRAA